MKQLKTILENNNLFIDTSNKGEVALCVWDPYEQNDPCVIKIFKSLLLLSQYVKQEYA